MRSNARDNGKVVLLGGGELGIEVGVVTDDVELAPLRVTWLAPDCDGDRTVRVCDLRHGGPRHPNRRRKQRIAEQHPDRVSVVAGTPALLSAVRSRPGAPRGSDPVELARFVEVQANLALERAEYRLRGAQYKVPRLAREDLMARLGKRIERPGYGDEIDHDHDQLARVRETLAKYPAVILPSHKSNLDATVIPVVLHENGLPPTHTFAGINMAFWPFGTIFRRAGRIFIRRDIKDDPVYRWVVRESETLGCALKFIRAQRGEFGKIYVWFGEPIPPKCGRPGCTGELCRSDARRCRRPGTAEAGIRGVHSHQQRHRDNGERARVPDAARHPGRALSSRSSTSACSISSTRPRRDEMR